MAIPLVVEIQLDDTALQTQAQKLLQLGEIDDATAVIFKKTNDQIIARNALLQQTIKDSTSLSVSVSENQAIYNKLAASVKTLSGSAKDAAQQMLKFSSGDLAAALKTQNVTIDQAIVALQKMGGSADSAQKSTLRLTTQLNEVKNALAALGPRTAENAQQFDLLASKGGELQESLNQTRGLIRNLGSESPVLSAFSESVTGVAGAFQAATGAAALFGDENKDLQETLVKVTSVTAIAQGVQQALNLVNKSGAITTLSLAASVKIQKIETQLDTIAKGENAVAAGAAAIAQKLLNAAFAANPVGLFFVVLTAVIGALLSFSEASRKSKEDQDNLNQSIEDSNLLFDLNTAATKRASGEQLQALDELNAKTSEKLRASAIEQQKITQEKIDKLNNIDAQIFANEESRDKDIMALVEQLKKDKIKAEIDVKDAIAETNNKISALRKSLSEEELQAVKDLADAKISAQVKNSDALFAAQRVAIVAQQQIELKAAGDNQEKRIAINAAADKAISDNRIAQLQADQVREQAVFTDALLQKQIISKRINSDITDEEVALQNAAIQKVADDQIAVAKKTGELTLVQQQEIQDKATAQIEQNNRDQLQRQITLVNQNAIALTDAELAGIKATNQERTDLQVQNVLFQQQIDLSAQNLTEQKRQAIIAKSEEQIRQIKNAAIQQQAEDEIAQTTANNAAANSELQRQLDAQIAIVAAGFDGAKLAKQLNVPILNLDQQKAAIDSLTKQQLDANNLLIKANFDKKQTAEEFAKTEVQLEANSVKIVQDGELKKQAAFIATDDAKRAAIQNEINSITADVNTGLQAIQSIYDSIAQSEQARLDFQKQKVQDELEAGVITAKAAAERNKELDAQQKQLQRDQAKRQKEFALFQAIINTASAIAVALTGGPILGVIQAALAAAIGAAQIAVISSTPLPQFYRGKNNKGGVMDNYEGWGNIGERGPELWKSGSKMHLAEKSSIVWLKRNDVVYNPTQTAAMMNSKIPVGVSRSQKMEFDYDKLGNAVAKKGNFSLNIDGYKDFIIQGENFTTKLNARRSWFKK